MHIDHHHHRLSQKVFRPVLCDGVDFEELVHAHEISLYRAVVGAVANEIMKGSKGNIARSVYWQRQALRHYHRQIEYY